MDSSQKAKYKEVLKRISSGNTNLDDLIGNNTNAYNRALQARNLAEETLASEVMKNTGTPIPKDVGNSSKYTDYLGRIQKERYPELDVDIELSDKLDGLGEYDPNTGKILIKGGPKKEADIVKDLSTLLHEGGHKFDDKVLNKIDTKEITKDAIEKLKSRGKMGLVTDAAEAYEDIAGDHHAAMMSKKLADKLGLDPAFRNLKTFGAGALEALSKKGTFRAVAPLAAGGVGLAVSAAAEAADAESGGMSPSQETDLLEKIDARKSYPKDMPEQDVSRWNKIRNQLSK